MSAATPGPSPSTIHCSPLLGISAIKAVGVDSSPELGLPLPRSPKGGTAQPGWGEGGRGTVSSFQRAAGWARQVSLERPAADSGAGSAALALPGLGAPLPQIQDPNPPPSLLPVCNGTSVLLPLWRQTALLSFFSSVLCDIPTSPTTVVRFVSAA